MLAGGRHGYGTLVMPAFNMAWPAGIGKIALPEGRGLEEAGRSLDW